MNSQPGQNQSTLFTDKQIANFYSKVEVTEGCHVWMRSTDSKGYGILTINNQFMRAHRVAWLMSGQEIPLGHGVLHKCDNPPCVKLGHLFTGTQAVNVHDMLIKGRHWRKRITPEQAFDIQLKRANGYPLKELSQEFGIAVSVVSRIANGNYYERS